jgi:hypothetical protein
MTAHLHAVRVAPPNRGALPLRAYQPRPLRRAAGCTCTVPHTGLLRALGHGVVLALMTLGLVVFCGLVGGGS